MHKEHKNSILYCTIHMNEQYEPYWSDYLKQFDLDDSYFQFIESNREKSCIIVEPRSHPLLVPVIKNFMFLLQKKGWSLVVMHGTQNESFIKSALQNWKNVHYVKLCIDNLTIANYNHFFASPILWETLQKLGCKYSLIFQTDVLLLKDNIDDFLDYDFIGAPWCVEMHDIKGGYNGGFSLRNVHTMLNICKTKKRLFYNSDSETPVNEDVFFAYHMTSEKQMYTLPTKETARQFSMETVYSADPTGLHKPHLSIFPSGNDYIQLLSKRYVK